ncbi:hypothetical protein BJV74DRAFT_799270 [Russula compacta]|nr:hypothetical protein BJV74DRAFT_799270 [Russula compacta]
MAGQLEYQKNNVRIARSALSYFHGRAREAQYPRAVLCVARTPKRVRWQFTHGRLGHQLHRGARWPRVVKACGRTRWWWRDALVEGAVLGFAASVATSNVVGVLTVRPRGVRVGELWAPDDKDPLGRDGNGQRRDCSGGQVRARCTFASSSNTHRHGCIILAPALAFCLLHVHAPMRKWQCVDDEGNEDAMDTEVGRFRW